MNTGNEPQLASLAFLGGPLAGKTYPITKTMIALGRDQTNDVVIPDPSVSRHHAQIICENGSWRVKKLVPQNTLTINQRDFTQSALNDRDTVGLGPETTFSFLLTANQLTPIPATLPPNVP